MPENHKFYLLSVRAMPPLIGLQPRGHLGELLRRLVERLYKPSTIIRAGERLPSARVGLSSISGPYGVYRGKARREESPVSRSKLLFEVALVQP